MTLAPFVRILARGPGRARSLTFDEAVEAMAVILRGQAAPEAIGAMLMLMRMKGETAEEIAGFVAAARASLPADPLPADPLPADPQVIGVSPTADQIGPVGSRPGLDWPSYASGRTRGLPWFLLSARLVGMAGVPVLLHGWNSVQDGAAAVRAALPGLGIPVAASLAKARHAAARTGIAYLPLEALSPQLFDLLRLRDRLGLRSCVNTVLRVLNPAGADASVQGVFHPSYRELQADAAAILGDRRVAILKGGGGEFERHPCKAISLQGLRDGQRCETLAPALRDDTRRLGDGPADPAAVAGLWAGTQQCDFAASVVIGTAALALEAAGAASDGLALAQDLWARRHTAVAA